MTPELKRQALDLRRWLDAEGLAHLEPETLARRLASVWDSFRGSGDQGMTGTKLFGRIEQPSWRPPILEFAIERHGGTVKGSIYAEVHRWRLDLEHATAEIVERRRRRLHKPQPPLDTRAIARGVAEAAALLTSEHSWLVRKDQNTVRILVGEIPELEDGSAVRQTLSARRKRFREALETAMAERGFTLVGLYRFSRISP
jgi:hypothetical protein